MLCHLFKRITSPEIVKVKLPTKTRLGTSRLLPGLEYILNPADSQPGLGDSDIALQALPP